MISLKKLCVGEDRLGFPAHFLAKRQCHSRGKRIGADEVGKIHDIDSDWYRHFTVDLVSERTHY